MQLASAVLLALCPRLAEEREEKRRGEKFEEFGRALFAWPFLLRSELDGERSWQANFASTRALTSADGADGTKGARSAAAGRRGARSGSFRFPHGEPANLVGPEFGRTIERRRISISIRVRDPKFVLWRAELLLSEQRAAPL